MRPLWYWLVDGKPTPVEVFSPEFAAWFDDAEHHRDVAKAVFANPTSGEVLVSTVFLALDHNHSGIGPPVLWETMVFGLPDGDEPCWRYSSVEAAWAGHERAVAYARARLAGRSPEDAEMRGEGE